MAKIFLIILIISCSFAIALGQADMAAASLANRAISNPIPIGQPVFGYNLAGGGNDARNWGASGTVGVGTRVWESSNGRHALGAGAAVSQDFGRHQGQIWRSPPSVGVGAGYRYNWESRNGRHAVGAGAGISQQFTRHQSSRPSYDVGATYTYRFRK